MDQTLKKPYLVNRELEVAQVLEVEGSHDQGQLEGIVQAFELCQAVHNTPQRSYGFVGNVFCRFQWLGLELRASYQFTWARKQGIAGEA